MSLISEFKVLYTLNGDTAAVADFPVEGGSTTGGSGGQDFTPGQVVVINSDTFVQEAKTGSDVVLGIAADAARIDGVSLVQAQPVGVYLFDRNTVFEAVPTTPANVISRADAGNSEAIFSALVDFSRTADTFAGVHTVDEDASTDDLWQTIDIDLTTNHVRLHLLGTPNCQWLTPLVAVATAPDISIAPDA